MATINEIYNRTLDIVEDLDSSIYIQANEGRRGLTIGNDQTVPQVVEVEFNGTVPDEIHMDLLQAVNGTGWEFVDEDDVFNGDNTGGGLITISRDIDPEELSTPEYEQEKYL